jgi:hypothetical protein
MHLIILTNDHYDIISSHGLIQLFNFLNVSEVSGLEKPAPLIHLYKPGMLELLNEV